MWIPGGGVSKTLHDPRSIKKRLGLSRVEMTSVTPENDSATQSRVTAAPPHECVGIFSLPLWSYVTHLQPNSNRVES